MLFDRLDTCRVGVDGYAAVNSCRKLLLVVVCVVVVALSFSCTGKSPVDRLISQMTIEEKIGQLTCPVGFTMYGKENDSLWLSEAFSGMMDTMPLGSCWAVLRADPWSQKTVETGLHPRESARLLNAMQRYAVEETRLGIPMLFCEETPHGHMAVGATVFPTGLAQASTWNRDLLEQMGEVMGKEIRAQGAHVGYGPVLDIARDPRWSRVEETLGEDPYLSGVLGSAIVEGMQRHIAATLKHLAAYGISQGGHNAANAMVGNNQLMNDYLPAFERVVRSGAKSVMTAYNTIDGVPCTANSWLLNEILRQSWNFNGVVFSDLNSINAIYATQHVAADPAEAAAMALKASVDVDLGGYSYGGFLKEALQRQLITEMEIDHAVRRVLQLKYDLGLFDNPYVDEEMAESQVGTAEHAELAKQVALESTVLLKNNGILPFNDAIKRVAVIGPNADNMYNQLGDYTAPQDPDRVVTMLEGIRAKGRASVAYAKGCAVRDEDLANIEEALNVARSADVVVLVVGGSSARDFKTSYEDTGAAIVDESRPDMDCGEGYDRSTLRLLGRQEELMRRVFALKKPVVTVYIQGRPLDMNLAAEQSDALLTMWYPGMEGGSALADILWGDFNPSGRLPISIPRSVGQIPVYYSQSQTNDYVEESAQPLYPFGYGLSYATFRYSDTHVEYVQQHDTVIELSTTVTNMGPYDGDEVVQVYVQDEQSSIVYASYLLKGFQRIHLSVGESTRVTIYLTGSDLSFYSTQRGRHFEPGVFTLRLGPNARAQ